MSQHNRARLICMTGVAVLLLSSALALGACGGTDSGNTATVKTYSDDTYGYSFQYPAGWKVQEANQADVTAGAAATASVGAYDPKGASAGGSYYDLVEVSVYELNTTIDESLMPQVKQEVEATLANLENQAGNWTVVEAMSEVSMAGLSGWKVAYNFDLDGTPARSTFYMLFGGALEYQLLLQATTADWDANQAAFQAFLSSFKPGSASATTSGS